jgi:hypothetical protein
MKVDMEFVFGTSLSLPGTSVGESLFRVSYVHGSA